MASQQKIWIEQVRTLYKRAVTVIPINILIAGILAVILLPVVEPSQILSWWAAMLVLCCIRLVHVFWANKSADFERDTKSLMDTFTLGTFITGLIWSSVFFMFVFTVPEVYIVFIIFSLGGMSVGAVASMATVPRVFFSYVCPMVIPPIIIFVFQTTPLGFAMSSMMLIYFISISSTYMQSYRLIKEGIQLQIDKDDLIQNLKRSNQYLEIANDKILTLSHTDELTQLYNRRYLDSTFLKEWGRAIRSQLPISFLMLDIDFFKDYNDTFGHQQGDQCLQKVSSCMRQFIKRPGDLVARYGGEEFAAILPDTTIEGALSLAETLRKAVFELRIPAANTTVSAFVTTSIGVACVVPAAEMHLNILISAADAALYRAKQSGRNQVIGERLADD